MIKQNWRNIAHMLGYSTTHCLVIEKFMEDKGPMDVYQIQKKLGMSRSLLSKVLKDLSERGILERIRSRHRFLYILNENFLYNMYESFVSQLRRNMDELKDGNIARQMEKIREHLNKFRGD